MAKQLEVIYENGVFRPLQPVSLRERQRGTVTIAEEEDWLDTDYMDACAEQANDDVSLERVREILAKIPGSLAAVIRDEREGR
jgi:predicted DNA-binding antitoxin AbrB/MazE fold protein